jgi:hypothetical protein
VTYLDIRCGCNYVHFQSKLCSNRRKFLLNNVNVLSLQYVIRLGVRSTYFIIKTCILPYKNIEYKDTQLREVHDITIDVEHLDLVDFVVSHR